MKNSFYPVLMTNDIQKEAEFFTELFDFKIVFNSDWYISLKDDDGFELALIDCVHETIPEQYRKQCGGVILNIETEDVNAVYSIVRSRNASSILSEIRDEDYGQRHFMVETPCRTLVDIIQIIPPANDYLENYQEAGNDDSK